MRSQKDHCDTSADGELDQYNDYVSKELLHNVRAE